MVIQLTGDSSTVYDARLVSGDTLGKFNARCKMGGDGAKRRPIETPKVGGRISAFRVRLGEIETPIKSIERRERERGKGHN